MCNITIYYVPVFSGYTKCINVAFFAVLWYCGVGRIHTEYGRARPGKEGIPVTIEEVIRELANIKNYCTASALPALDYAIAVLEKQRDEQEPAD